MSIKACSRGSEVAWPAFGVARLPEIRFGRGRVAELADSVVRYGQRALLITGSRSFLATPHWPRLLEQLREQAIAWRHQTVDGEPSPELVDGIVAEYRGASVEVVVGIGGGSVLDSAKAVAGLLIPGNSVLDHLEGVGRDLPYRGPALPWLAVPTTAGTGSEATKNAVLSRRGVGGYKKSFRDARLVARVAIVDPELLVGCPPPLLAANAMDAFTQLLESLVSCQASPFTDALVWSGLEAFRDGLWSAWEGDPDRIAGLERLAYASLISGISLAQAGLGLVHGLAAPLGAWFPIPHGVACGTLVAEATALNIRALRERCPDSPALAKYARVAELLTQERYGSAESAHQALVSLITDWQRRLELPSLSRYGVAAEHLEGLVTQCRGGSMRTNPLVLSDAELVELLRTRC